MAPNFHIWPSAPLSVLAPGFKRIGRVRHRSRSVSIPRHYDDDRGRRSISNENMRRDDYHRHRDHRSPDRTGRRFSRERSREFDRERKRDRSISRERRRSLSKPHSISRGKEVSRRSRSPVKGWNRSRSQERRSRSRGSIAERVLPVHSPTLLLTDNVERRVIIHETIDPSPVLTDKPKPIAKKEKKKDKERKKKKKEKETPEEKEARKKRKREKKEEKKRKELENVKNNEGEIDPTPNFLPQIDVEKIIADENEQPSNVTLIHDNIESPSLVDEPTATQKNEDIGFSPPTELSLTPSKDAVISEATESGEIPEEGELEEEDEVDEEPAMLAPLPELSRWELDDSSIAQPVKHIVTSPDGPRVTSEVLKRAENAIFKKAISALRTEPGKHEKTETIKVKSSVDLKKEKAIVDGGTKKSKDKRIEETVKKAPNDRFHRSSLEIPKKSEGRKGNSIQVTVPNEKEERNVEYASSIIKDDRAKSSLTPPRLSIKDRLGSKIETSGRNPSPQASVSRFVGKLRDDTLENRRLPLDESQFEPNYDVSSDEDGLSKRRRSVEVKRHSPAVEPKKRTRSSSDSEESVKKKKKSKSKKEKKVKKKSRKDDTESSSSDSEVEEKKKHKKSKKKKKNRH